MNSLHYISTKNIYAICFCICAATLPLLVSANTSVVQETNTQIYSSSVAGGDGNASVDISHTSIINGEETSYQYSTSSPTNIEHSVRLENGVVVSETKENFSIRTNDSNRIPTPLHTTNAKPVVSDTELSPEDAQQLWDLINYLYWYVIHVF